MDGLAVMAVHDILAKRLARPGMDFGGLILRYRPPDIAPRAPDRCDHRIITGTPEVVAAPTLYTVTGLNFVGSVRTGLLIRGKGEGATPLSA